MNETENAKTQLREHLSSLLVPRLAEGFWSIQASAQQLCERNAQLDQVIRTFQNMVTKIPEWSESTIIDEVERIITVSKCGYMDDLLMGVFLSYMKSFASLQYKGHSSQVKIEFERPNVSKFIHELYKHSARKIWQSAFLFKTLSVSTEQQARNRQEVEQLIYKTLDEVIRGFLPWEVIAKSYFTEAPTQDAPPPPPASKAVLFEDIPSSDDESEEEEQEDKPRTLHVLDEEDRLSVTDLDEKKEVVAAEEMHVEVDPLAEIEGRVKDETLVLNL